MSEQHLEFRRERKRDGQLDYDGKSIHPNLSLSVVLLKLTGQRDDISPGQYGVKPVPQDFRPPLLFNLQTVFALYVDDEIM